MKVKLFTHDDLDGISCGILGKMAFHDKVDINYCKVSNIDECVKRFIKDKQYLKYKYVFITDLSVNEEVASLISKTIKKKQCNSVFQLLDHHKTAEWLNKYFWANVEVDLNIEERNCGARMFYDYLTDGGFLVDINNYTLNYIENVRKYDVWQWKEEDNLIPKQYNDIFRVYGRDYFISKVLDSLEQDNVFELYGIDFFILKLEQDKIDKYIYDKNKQITERIVLGYNAGIVFGEQYHSELGNSLAELNPHLDLIAIIDLSKSISFRTIRKDIDLGKDVASIYGGGGHPQASGCSIGINDRNKVLDVLLGDS